MDAVKFTIRVGEQAEKTLAGIRDKRVRAGIAKRIGQLAEEPEKQGKPLIEELAGYRSVRAVGQRYRIVYQVQEHEVVVFVVLVVLRKEGDRKDVYALAQKLLRLGLLDPPPEDEP